MCHIKRFKDMTDSEEDNHVVIIIFSQHVYNVEIHMGFTDSLPYKVKIIKLFETLSADDTPD
jgi:hypothetical protein